QGTATIKPYADLPELHFAHDAGTIDLNGDWYRNFQYRVEQERGLDFAEDLFNPFSLSFDLTKASGRARIIASTEPHIVADVDSLREQELARRRAVAGDSANPLIRALTIAADQFIVARTIGHTIIAGYHWFSDWGRDTMIALPGLLLATGRTEIAKSVLLEFAQQVDQGMLPNRFPDAGETPEYNTVDATLWFFDAVRALLQYTADEMFVRQNLYGVLAGIIDWHIKGTRYGIHLDDDGLLYSGEPGVQLTWMDAKVGDWVITPRHGKPVEIQALWYNALRIMEDLATRFEDEAGRMRYAEMADQTRDSFGLLFWNADAGCLYDVVDGGDLDGSIRPNQLFALSLSHSMVPSAQAEQILQVVERELLTPRGLRTLSPNDPRYAGRYLGDPRRRDSVYHQGTVWPWLMGAYITAQVKVSGQAGRDLAALWLENFQEHLAEACLGQVSEIFDGDAPHTPRGCVAQAWSVAELLRAAVEDVYDAEPSVPTVKTDQGSQVAGK
ncbi:MAG: amylo-alpha-1,6-glucosidase, partial [Pyrinomonadaceae bacterium]